MDIKKIEKVLEKEPAFRLKQVKKAIFGDLVGGWNEVTTLSQALRQKLAESCPLLELEAEKVLTSKDDQTVKALFRLKDGLKIESVLMKHEDGAMRLKPHLPLISSLQEEISCRRTVCVSSQAGCAMHCQFCATGQQGFKRNLSSSEIIDQIIFFSRLLKETKERVSNIVFMGMGEPFLNYQNVLEAIRILNDKDGLNIGSRHISISTCGVTEGIKKLAEEKLQVNLAISLNASNNELRTKLMPINKDYPVEKILAAVEDYVKQTKRKVMFEYLMIDGVNDSPAQARELTKLLKKPLYFVNLISFNPVGHSIFKPSAGKKIKIFKETLEKAGVQVTQRHRFGKEIKAACGQLAGGR